MANFQVNALVLQFFIVHSVQLHSQSAHLSSWIEFSRYYQPLTLILMKIKQIYQEEQSVQGHRHMFSLSSNISRSSTQLCNLTIEFVIDSIDR